MLEDSNMQVMKGDKRQGIFTKPTVITQVSLCLRLPYVSRFTNVELLLPRIEFE